MVVGDVTFDLYSCGCFDKVVCFVFINFRILCLRIFSLR